MPGCKSYFLMRRETTVASQTDEDLPLHLQYPPVEFLDWCEADKLVSMCSPPHEVITWNTLTSTYRDASVAQQFVNRSSALGCQPLPQWQSTTNLLRGDFEQMLRCKFVIPLQARPEEVLFPIKLFSVIEERSSGLRRRLIGWPLSTNDFERAIYEEAVAPLSVPFATAASARTAAVRKYAAQADFKKYFQQFELVAKSAFCFVHRHQVFTLASVPTGAVGPPVFAEILTRAVTAFAIRKCNAGTVVHADTMIDNVRFSSDDYDALVSVWQAFIDCCKTVGITIGDSMSPTLVMQPYTFMGISFDHANHTVSLTEKTKRKLVAARDFVFSARNQNVLVSDIASAFGITLTAAQTLNTALHDHYFVFKFIKRIAKYAAAAPNYDVAMHKIWNSVIEPWSDWISAMLASPEAVVRHLDTAAATSCVAYSDASDSGWGMIIYWPDGSVTSHGQPWSQLDRSLHINRKELKAAMFVIERVSQEATRRGIPELRIALNIDNTTAIAWLTRGHADAREVNTMLGRIASLPHVAVQSITYCRSEDNPADAPSRYHHKGQGNDVSCP